MTPNWKITIITEHFSNVQITSLHQVIAHVHFSPHIDATDIISA